MSKFELHSSLRGATASAGTMATFETFTPSFRVQKAACEKCHNRKVKCDVSSRSGPCSNCLTYGETCTLRTRKRKASGVQKRTSIPTEASNSSSPSGADRRPQPPRTHPHSNQEQRGVHHGTGSLIGAPLLFVQGLASPRETRTENVITSQPSPDEFQNSGYLSRRAILSDDFPNLDHSHVRSRRQSFSLPQRDIDSLHIYRAFELPSMPIRQSLVDAYLARAWTWMPVVNPNQISLGTVANPSSLVLAHALLMVGSQMRRSIHPEASTADCYQKLKVLVDVGQERNPVALLSSLCLIQWWTPVAPKDLSTNSTQFWLCCAVGLAQQVGLHRQPTKGTTDISLRRRIWWTLYARDCIVSAAHGRPRLINLADCSVERPRIEDFPSEKPLQSRIFIAYVYVIEILGDLCQILTRQKEATMEQKNEICSRLITWIQNLPPDLRLRNLDGSSRPYDVDIAQLHVPLLTSITILYRPRSIFNLSASSAAAVVAANHSFRIFEAMELRDDTFSLASAYAWYMFVAAVPQLSCLRIQGGLGEDARQRLSRLEEILHTLSAVRPAATNTLRNIQSLRKHFECTELPSARRFEQTGSLEQNASSLFSSEDLFTHFGPDAVQEFHNISAMLEAHQTRSLPNQRQTIEYATPANGAADEALLNSNQTDDSLYGGFPELLGSGFADSSWMRNWIDELQIPGG
jgi:hypothetical protein